MTMNSNKKLTLALYIEKQLVHTYQFNLDDIDELFIGRSSKNDIVVPLSIVSTHHAKIQQENGELFVTDLDSTNGLWIENERVESHPLTLHTKIYFGEMDVHNNDGNYLCLEENLLDEMDVATETRTKQVEEHLVSFEDVDSLSIGRKSTNDIPVLHNLVSREHALIEKIDGDLYIRDLNSTNGTFVNGERIKKKVQLVEGDQIYIGHAKFLIEKDHLVYYLYDEGLQLDAIQITKDVIDSSSKLFRPKKTKRILDNISLQVKPGELVALVGGSGAGKSTLMDTLNGFRPSSAGKVFINNDDFYENYEAYKNILGYVPQQDIVYDTLTVEDMLTYAARLRMPEDSSEEDIERRVIEVIDDVDLVGREDVVISQLSGGQRKRASIAVELLADPKLFFLDEPTSGLDPSMERSMMHLLRKLSNQGKTIILITHATANLHICDKVAFLGYGGKLCYFGAPEFVNDFFELEEFADIYEQIHQEPDYWAEKFSQTDYASYTDMLSNKEANKQKLHVADGHHWFKQFLILSSRYLKLNLKDKQKMTILFAQSPLIALLLVLVGEKDSFDYYESSKVIIFTTASAAVWIGLLNSIQEIVKEKTIYARERAVNLKLFPYVASKVFILGILGVIQTILFMGIFILAFEHPSEHLIGSLLVEIMITFFLTLMASTVFGLVVSSISSNPDRALSVAPILLIPQLIFNGLVFELKGITEFISYFIISKWTARAISISYDLNSLPMEIETEIAVPPRDTPAYYEHSLSLLLQNWFVLILFILICFALSILILKRRD